MLVRVWLLWLLILSCYKIFLPCDWPVKSCQEVALVVPDDLVKLRLPRGGESETVLENGTNFISCCELFFKNFVC